MCLHGAISYMSDPELFDVLLCGAKELVGNVVCGCEAHMRPSTTFVVAPDADKLPEGLDVTGKRVVVMGSNWGHALMARLVTEALRVTMVVYTAHDKELPPFPMLERLHVRGVEDTRDLFSWNVFEVLYAAMLRSCGATTGCASSDQACVRALQIQSHPEGIKAWLATKVWVGIVPTSKDVVSLCKTLEEWGCALSQDARHRARASVEDGKVMTLDGRNVLLTTFVAGCTRGTLLEIGAGQLQARDCVMLVSVKYTPKTHASTVVMLDVGTGEAVRHFAGRIHNAKVVNRTCLSVTVSGCAFAALKPHSDELDSVFAGMWK